MMTSLCVHFSQLSNVETLTERGRNLKIFERDFEKFYEKNRILFDDNECTEMETRKYFMKTWKKMTKTQRDNCSRREHVIEESDSSDYSELDNEEKNIKRITPSLSEKENIAIILPKQENSIDQNHPLVLFKKDERQEKNCSICHETGQVILCNGPCSSYFHLSCIKPKITYSKCENNNSANFTENTTEKDNFTTVIKDKQTEDKLFMCPNCSSEIVSKRFTSNKEETAVKCNIQTCEQYYHVTCLQTLSQSYQQDENVICSRHMCHTCSSGIPQRNNLLSIIDENLIKCTRCPTAYHFSVYCIPVNSTVLSNRHMTCPKHFKINRLRENATWCFACAEDKSDVFCIECPVSYHARCIGLTKPVETYRCKDCVMGRLPTYGGIVWVKLADYRGWPSLVCFPQEIPQKVMTLPHKPDEFCVLFLGTNNYSWVYREKIFIYQGEQDNAKFSCGMEFTGGIYQKAIDDANKFYVKYNLQRRKMLQSEINLDEKLSKNEKTRINEFDEM